MVHLCQCCRLVAHPPKAVILYLTSKSIASFTLQRRMKTICRPSLSHIRSWPQPVMWKRGTAPRTTACSVFSVVSSFMVASIGAPARSAARASAVYQLKGCLELSPARPLFRLCSRACCLRRTPLGMPVVPEVKKMAPSLFR